MPSSKASSPRRSRSRSSHHDRRKERRIEKSAKLFVTNIDSKISNEQLKKELNDLFGKYGDIVDTVIKTKPGSDNSFAFVEFKTTAEAEKALENLKGTDFKGKELKVQFGRGGRKERERASHGCYICRRDGHYAKDCPDNRDRGYPRRRSSSREHKRYSRRSRSRSSDRGNHRGSRYDQRPRRRYSRSKSYERRRDERRRSSRSRSHGGRDRNY